MAPDERRVASRPELEREPPPQRSDEEEREARADEAEDLRVSGMGALLGDGRRIALGALLVVAIVIAIYVLFPRVVGFDDELARIQDAAWYWVAIAVAFNVGAFGAYVALFRGVLGGAEIEAVRARLDVNVSYQITMAGLAATRIFSAAGAGGVALTYWALRKAGMPRRLSACRMLAFLVLLYSVYGVALILFGVLLRTGVLPGEDPVAGTIVPAALAGGALLVGGLVALIPDDLERYLVSLGDRGRFGGLGRLARRLAPVPSTAARGIRTAIAYVRHPRRGALAVTGAVGFWAANIGVLWASFEAFGGDVPFGVLVQGFFVGMAANLIPSPAGGVGAVDAGMIGAFLLFGVPGGIVFPAVLTYRVIAFWLPIPPGVVAFFQLRRTVARWSGETRGYTSESKATVEAR